MSLKTNILALLLSQFYSKLFLNPVQFLLKYFSLESET